MQVLVGVRTKSGSTHVGLIVERTPDEIETWVEETRAAMRAAGPDYVFSLTTQAGLRLVIPVSSVEYLFVEEAHGQDHPAV